MGSPQREWGTQHYDRLRVSACVPHLTSRTRHGPKCTQQALHRETWRLDQACLAAVLAGTRCQGVHRIPKIALTHGTPTSPYIRTHDGRRVSLLHVPICGTTQKCAAVLCRRKSKWPHSACDTPHACRCLRTQHAYMVCEGYAQHPGMCSKPLHTVELDLDCVGEEHEYVIQAVRARCEHGSKQVRQRGRLLDAAGGVGHRMHAPSHHREPQRRRRRALCLWFGYMGAQQSW